MLHNISDDGTLSWFCDNPRCEHHNCGSWEEVRTCTHAAHFAHTSKPQGKPLNAHVDHEQIEYTGKHVIALPACPCGTRMFLNVNLSDEETAPPVLVKHPETDKIIAVLHQVSPNFHITESHVETHKQIQSNGMLMEVPVTIYDRVYPHPFIARHKSLVEHMAARGKAWQGIEALAQKHAS